MAWEGISLQAKRTDPDLRSYIDITERIEDSLARCSAHDWVILKQLIAEWFERSQTCAYRNHKARCFLLSCQP